MRRLVWRLTCGGLIAAIVVWLAGWGVERARFGASDDAAMARVEAELRQRFEVSADTLGTIASTVGAERQAIQMAPRDVAAARRLFDLAAAALPPDEGGRLGLTIYGLGTEPLAWAGTVSDVPRERVAGPAALFVSPGALGPRLVRIEPFTAPSEPRPLRYATVVVEELLERGAQPAEFSDASFVVSTTLAPVTLRIPRDPWTEPSPSFSIPSRGGGVLVDAVVTPADIDTARLRVQGQTRAAMLGVIALTLLLCAGPLLDARRHARTRRRFAFSTGALVIVLTGVRLVAWFAAAPLLGRRSLSSPPDLLLTALWLAALVWIAFDTMARCRVAGPRTRLWQHGPSAAARVALVFVVAAALGTGLIAGYERLLERLVARTTLDVLQFSLHPADAARLAMTFALVLLHAVAIWGGAAFVYFAMVFVRTPRRGLFRNVAVASAVGGWLLTSILLQVRFPDLPLVPWSVATLTAGGCAIAAARLSERARRRSQVARLGALFLALVVPALAMYPSLLSYSSAAKERLVAVDFAPLALSQREDLQTRLRHALDDVDGVLSLPDLVRSAVAAPTSDRAFLVWSQTELARYRLTSAIELYGAGGRLVSRFALNLPEYGTNRRATTGCNWELFDEVSPFGSTERHVLDASRSICRDGQAIGAVVVRLMLDYRTLPFISSQSPYLESLRPDQPRQLEGAPGGDVEFVVYGWSRGPLYASGISVWPLPDATFQRMVSSREPFWTTLTRDDNRYRVYFVSDRGGIFGLGYPASTGLGHLMAIAELVTLAGVLYVALLAGSILLETLTTRAVTSGRTLLHEIRTSFYRKLFLAFVLATVVPVVTLALATQTYFATELRAGIEDAAARTATVAERLVEDYATLQQQGIGATGALDDQIMVLVGRAINEDVNLFDRARLQATSERDLFASGLLTTRTPASVYRTIVLDRLPTFVGVEHVGDVRYLLAAAPVRAGAQEGIVTVPVTLRQQEIERQIDELNRRVLVAAVLFVLFGAAVGYWMAERIADPVNRLTRVTRQITRGNLDASTTATSADELGRLIGDFNEMARELKRQRAELERTQRLEAWADMARQVAHDIKNPLTPIQLSAEHARRINADRGKPLSPVLDECVNVILSQVRLLRRSAAEFSSFASSPTPRLEPVNVSELFEEVIAPYRVGLGERVVIDVSIPAELPAVLTDRTLVGRALTNVIENAVHAMPSGGRLSVAVSSSTSGADRVLIMRLSDTGVGLDQEALARIFEPYFSTKATGTGLGLTIARRNVELVGGAILVSSSRGVGTTVTITLPLTTA